MNKKIVILKSKSIKYYSAGDKKKIKKNKKNPLRFYNDCGTYGQKRFVQKCIRQI